MYSFRDEKLGREWIRNLYLVELSTPEIKLDWEHTDYRWISPDEIDNFETTPGLTKDLKKVKLLQ